MLKRWLQDELLDTLDCRRGVFLTGARQVGKSTLASALKLQNCRRYSFDEKKICEAAMNDPYGFVAHAAGETLVLDEVQKVPDILEAVKMVVDKDNTKGQYLLTGSSNLRFAKSVHDSLAGRLGHLRLRPLAFGEIAANKPTFLSNAFARNFPSSYSGIDKRDILEVAFRGGYPEVIGLKAKQQRGWFRDYLDDLVEKDVRDLTDIRKVDILKSAALWLLAHTSQFFSLEELASKTGVSKVTAENYLEALRALYLFDRVPAWVAQDAARVGKRPKWVACDSGMVAALLGWNAEEVYLDESRSGKLIESWVYQQLAAQADSLGGYSISHYRDNKKREIDFLVTREDGAILGVEVKSGTVSLSDFKHLKWFAKEYEPASFTGVVLYSGKDVLRFGEGFYAVPLAALG